VIGPEVIPLSPGAANVLQGELPDRVIEAVSRGELHAYRVAAPKGRVLVCPGGGYLRLMHDREGTEIAQWLNGLGYDAFVLAHRLPGAPGEGGVWPEDVALTDGLAALSQIGRDLPLFVLGLSSGGHLAGVLACQPGVDAAGLLIAYAPINANHSDYKAPAGKPDYPPPQKQAFYDAWPIGLAAEPHGVPRCPVFLAYALHDPAVPIEHALNFIRTARDEGLDLDAHVFGAAPHGFALRELDGTQAAWPNLAAGWMARKAV
jgi:acetyl esterase/lipase